MCGGTYARIEIPLSKEYIYYERIEIPISKEYIYIYIYICISIYHQVHKKEYINIL